MPNETNNLHILTFTRHWNLWWARWPSAGTLLLKAGCTRCESKRTSWRRETTSTKSFHSFESCKVRPIDLHTPPERNEKLAKGLFLPQEHYLFGPCRKTEAMSRPSVATCEFVFSRFLLVHKRLLTTSGNIVLSMSLNDWRCDESVVSDLSTSRLSYILILALVENLVDVDAPMVNICVSECACVSEYVCVNIFILAFF